MFTKVHNLPYDMHLLTVIYRKYIHAGYKIL